MGSHLRVLLGDGVTLRGVGLDDVGAPDNFSLRLTMPTTLNTGIPVGTAMTNYDPDITTPRSVYVDTPGAIISNKDFGNIRLIIRTSGVRVLRCRWNVTDNTSNVPMISTNSASAVGVYVEQCEVTNYDQAGYNFNAFEGHDVWYYRCKVMGTSDGIRANLGGNVKIHGCLIGYQGWWANEGTPYINSGNQSHADCIQTQYGAGIEIIGNSLVGYPATWVGTGTPGSGSDTGNTGSWYTQAEAEARRAAVFSATTDPAKGYDGVAHESGGTITPLMLNRTQGPNAFNAVVEDNWIAGGVVQVNGLDTNLTSPVGSFKRNKHFNDAFYKQAGKSLGYRFAVGLTGTVPQSGADMNTYMDSGLAVPIVY